MSIIIGIISAIFLFCILLILNLFIKVPICIMVIASILYGIMNFLKALQDLNKK